jgi:tetratricopeptide (TPR) repeat protein
MEALIMRRLSFCLVSLSIISLLFIICLQAQEIPNKDVPKILGVQTPPAQRPLAALSPQEIFKRASPSVVVVQSLDVKGTVTAFGSGVVIAPGQVITNRHVVENGVSFRVEHGTKTWSARLVKVDPDHDLAELSVDGLTAPAVRVRDSSTLAEDEKVYAIGSPQGLELIISEGLILRLRDFDKGWVIQTSAAISHGSSGGGLFDAEGRMVGITTFFLKEGQSLNFALPGEWTLALDRQPATATPSASENSPAFQSLLWFEIGYKAGEAGKYEQAITAYQEAIRLKPNDAEALGNLGVAYNRLGQYDKAISAYQEAIRLKPDFARAWANLGEAYKHNGQQSDVIKVYEKLKTLDPKLAEGFFQKTVAAPKSAEPIPDAATATRLVHEGGGLSAQQVNELEARLKDTPDDLPTRARLLGYYFAKSIRVAGPEATRAARRRHILWLIEHHPENDITMLSEFTIDPTGHLLADADGYEQAKKLWLDQIDHRKDKVRVLMHAARFFQLSDKALSLACLKQAVQLAPNDHDIASQLGYTYAITALGITMINNNGLPMAADPVEASGEVAKTAINELRASSNPVVVAVAGSILSQYGAMIQAVTKGAINQDALAEELLVRASALNPNDPGPPRSLSQLYFLRMIRAGTPEERTALAKKWLAQAEMVVDRTTGNREWHIYALITASKAAIDAGAFDKARGFATDMLKQVADPPDTRDGQAFHDGHVVLGRVALKAGDVEQAKGHLLQAGRAPGGGTLSSFGPNMALAKELLEKGEKQVVIQYLEECKKFWSAEHGQLNQWIATINAGGVPQFGGNLIY